MPGGDNGHTARPGPLLLALLLALLVRRLSSDGDETGINDATPSATLFSVPRGTRCVVVQPGHLLYEVEVMEGDHTSARAFVRREHISKE